jgi:hypothetical protein
MNAEEVRLKTKELEESLQQLLDELPAVADTEAMNEAFAITRQKLSTISAQTGALMDRILGHPLVVAFKGLQDCHSWITKIESTMNGMQREAEE